MGIQTRYNVILLAALALCPVLVHSRPCKVGNYDCNGTQADIETRWICLAPRRECTQAKSWHDAHTKYNSKCKSTCGIKKRLRCGKCGGYKSRRLTNQRLI